MTGLRCNSQRPYLLLWYKLKVYEQLTFESSDSTVREKKVNYGFCNETLTVWTNIQHFVCRNKHNFSQWILFPKDSSSTDKLLTFFLGEVRDHEEICLIRDMRDMSSQCTRWWNGSLMGRWCKRLTIALGCSAHEIYTTGNQQTNYCFWQFVAGPNIPR